MLVWMSGVIRTFAQGLLADLVLRGPYYHRHKVERPPLIAPHFVGMAVD